MGQSEMYIYIDEYEDIPEIDPTTQQLFVRYVGQAGIFLGTTTIGYLL